MGINLLREGLDIPEISLVAILDADKEGFLRSETSLVQTIGRAARNADGHVIMYADCVTDSMRHAIDETKRRRMRQQEYNTKHHITPTSIKKAVRDLISISKSAEAVNDIGTRKLNQWMPGRCRIWSKTYKKKAMNVAAAEFNFEQAAVLRDKIAEIRKKSEDKVKNWRIQMKKRK